MPLTPATTEQDTKTCLKCGRERPLSDFGMQKRGAAHRPKARCKPCLAAGRRADDSSIVSDEAAAGQDDTMDDAIKACTKCRQEKPLSEFGRQKYEGGYRVKSRCRECLAADRRAADARLRARGLDASHRKGRAGTRAASAKRSPAPPPRSKRGGGTGSISDFFKTGEQVLTNEGFSGKAAAAWAAAPFGTETAKQWQAAGFTVDEATSWHLEGFRPDTVAEWRALGFTPPQADRWRSARVDPADAAEWCRIGVDSVSLACEWRARGVRAEQLGPWLETGFDARLAAHHHGTRFDPVAWMQRGVDPQQAAVWRDAGVDAAVAKAWADDRRPIREKSEWAAAGFRPDEVGEWQRNGFSPDEAAFWSELGEKPSSAARLVRDGLTARSLGRTVEWNGDHRTVADLLASGKVSTQKAKFLVRRQQSAPAATAS